MVRDSVALVVGPGPVTLQEGTSIQYLAARGCRYLCEKGYRVIVLEDNPATLMDAWDEGESIFLEPILPEVVLKAAEKAGAGSVWLGMAGRRGWELFKSLSAEGTLERLGISVPDMDDRALWLCGDRGMLRETLEGRGFANPVFRAVDSMHEGQRAAAEMSFPLVARPHFSSGGWGAGMAYNVEEFPAVMEEALKESPTGEVLLEESLAGYRKFVVVLLRDEGGDCFLAGACEQLEPLPLHDEDAVLVVPPVIGGEEAYALREAAREAADALGLVGLAEVKLAASQGWEDLYVLDVNPRPWRVTPLLEVFLGKDLVRMHIDLLLGGDLQARGDAWERGPRGMLLSLPRFFYGAEGDGGPLRLHCRAVGRVLFAAKAAQEAAAAARKYLDLEGRAQGYEERWLLRTGELLSGLSARKVSGCGSAGGPELRGQLTETQINASCGGVDEGAASGPAGKRRAEEEACGKDGFSAALSVARGGACDGVPSGDSAERGYPLCLLRRLRDNTSVAEGKLMILGGDNGVPGGGHEHNFAAFRALQAARRKGLAAALYACDASFALLAAEAADTVFLGPLSPQGVEAALRGAGINTLCCQFAGEQGLQCGWDLSEKHAGLALLERATDGDLKEMDLAGLARQGVRTVPFANGIEDARAFMERCAFPLLADVKTPSGPPRRRILFSAEEGKGYLSRYGGAHVLLRELCEEAQEVLVEAVCADGETRALLMWEKLEDKGTASTEGLAVFPPLHLTSHQAQAAGALAREVISRLGWRGNLSMRMVLSDGEALLWDIALGASTETPFLARASGLPLPEMGLEALLGEGAARLQAEEGTYAWRCSVTPLNVIAAEDIIPGARRRSTGSLVGMAAHPSLALAKVHRAQGLMPCPGGRVFMSMANREKRRAVLLARELSEAGYLLCATRGTARTLQAAGMMVKVVNKLHEGRPNALDLIRNGEIQLVINVPRGRKPKSDGFYIREDAARHGIPCITDMDAAMALVRGLRVLPSAVWEIDLCESRAAGVCRLEGAGGK